MLASPLLHIVLHQPEIAANTGNIGRTCVALGAKLWLVRPLGFRVDDYYLRRAGLDYWEHLAWQAVDDWPALLAELTGARDGRAPQPYFFSKSAQRLYTDVRFAPGDVLVFGSESAGLPPSIMAEAGDYLLRLPLLGPVRSLNLSNAVAIAAYEALRQFQEH
ncbi:MAG TPA: tRNA (cytidine(34)-2'-O)-methyltransferase [Pirellulales bacterium]|jgi:tRNA (cytidine/uridine-2'-O-)-methyltransferase|nr:tRNA (cytidine(34)-2'-O)-methyltransferase [Pirellulales bacterium]